jgi:RNA polymerase sigma-B factor
VSSTQRHPAAIERDQLIESNLPLARTVARRYAGRGVDLDDLVQVGAVGLIKAADAFDPGRGVAFTTFATHRIEGEIRHHLRDQKSALRIPRELQRMSGELQRRRVELVAKLGRSPTVSELATALNADEGEVQRALIAERAGQSSPVSHDDPAPETVAGSEPFASSDDRLLLAGSVRTLDERERRIVYLRFHADMTERQIALEVGISQAHVSRLLTGALAKLRHELAHPGDAGTRRDITQTAAIPPPSETRKVPEESRASHPPSARSGAGRSGNGKIADVGAPQSVEKSLELPYQVAVTRENDGDEVCWTATVEGLPDCSARGATREEAVARLRPVMESWLTAALAEARGPAEPSADVSKRKTTHSGRFLVRMPSALHEQLAQAAEREKVSLNRFVTDALAATVIPPPPARPTTAEQLPRSAGRASGRTVRIALAANLFVVVCAGLIAAALLVLALERGI